MTPPRFALSFTLIFLFGSLRPALPATLLVTTPETGICVTSQDATFDYRWGDLHPQTGLFSYAPVGQTPLEPKVTVPQSATPGDLLRLEVTEPEDVDSVVARILGPKQETLSRGFGFRPSVSTEKERWVVLVGVSSLTAPGSYTLSVTIKAGARSALYLSTVVVLDRKFRFEKIGLTVDLTQMRESTDPRKAAETRELVRIITTADTDAIFETGMMRNPLPEACRTSGFGDRRKYVFPDNSSDFSVHEGLDLAAPEGTPVPACGRGRVVLAGERIITGNTVVIEHLPGLFSLYFHLSQMLVKVGDVVAEGDVIGKVGQTGFATGPHLHWEIEALGTPVDPDALVAAPILDKSADSGEIVTGKASKGGE